jgi:hypothetical protein
MGQRAFVKIRLLYAGNTFLSGRITIFLQTLLDMLPGRAGLRLSVESGCRKHRGQPGYAFGGIRTGLLQMDRLGR